MYANHKGVGRCASRLHSLGHGSAQRTKALGARAQAPLQPLQDNLELQTYETFEKDTTKYSQYEEAVLAALLDRVPDAEAATRETVLMVPPLLTYAVGDHTQLACLPAHLGPEATSCPERPVLAGDILAPGAARGGAQHSSTGLSVCRPASRRSLL